MLRHGAARYSSLKPGVKEAHRHPAKYPYACAESKNILSKYDGMKSKIVGTHYTRAVLGMAPAAIYFSMSCIIWHGHVGARREVSAQLLYRRYENLRACISKAARVCGMAWHGSDGSNGQP